MLEHLEYMKKKSTKKAFEMGVDCSIFGMSLAANPYRNYEGMTEEYFAWEAGWHSTGAGIEGSNVSK